MKKEKFIIEESSVVNKAMALCPKCGNFPLIEMRIEREPIIKIECDCFENKVYLLSDYVKEMNHSNIIFNFICNKHNKEFECYCVNCLEHLCEKCVNEEEHKEHMIKKIKLINIDKKKEEKKKVIQQYQSYLTDLKKNCISKFSNEESRMTIQNAYEDCMKRNEELIMLIELIMNSYVYNESNFYANYNLENFTNFEVKAYKGEIEDTEKVMKNIIDYFNTFYLLTNDITIDSSITQCRKNYVDIRKFKLNHSFETKEQKDIIDIVRLNDTKVSFFNLSTIFIYNIDTHKCDIEIKNDLTKSLTDLIALNSSNIVAGSLDKTISFYNIKETTYEITKIITHNRGLTQIFKVSDNQIAVCDDSGDIQIFDINTEEKHTLKGNNTQDIKIYITIGNYLVSKENLDINVWNLNDYSKIYSVPYEEYSRINYIHYDSNSDCILAGTYCKYSKIDLQTGNIISKVDISNDIISYGSIPYKKISLREGNELYCFNGLNGRIGLKSKKGFKTKHISIKTLTTVNKYAIAIVYHNKIEIWNY